MTRCRGFSLIELMVATFVLALLIGGIFFSFDYGSRSFRVSNARQSIQGELTRAYDALRHDLRRCHSRTVWIDQRQLTVDGVPRRRDAVCMASLIDWNSPQSFDEVNGLPKWDRYVLYYATAGGQLVRCLIDPADTDYSPVRYDGTLPLAEDPETNGGEQTAYSTLSRRLLEFEVTDNLLDDRVGFRIVVSEPNGRTMDMAEVRLDVTCQNTWPRTGD